MIRTSDRQAMFRAYLAISEMVLEDETYGRVLAAQPAAELEAAGWPLPEGTAVEVTFFDPNAIDGEMLTPEAITSRWAQAIEAGALRLEFAEAPLELQVVELSETELEGVNGGFCGSCIGPMPPPTF